MQNHNDGIVKGGAAMKTLYQRAFDAVQAAAAKPWCLELEAVAAARTGSVERHHAGSLLGNEATISLKSRLAEAEEAYRAHPSNEVLKTAVETLRGDVARRMASGGMSATEAMKTLRYRCNEAEEALKAGISQHRNPRHSNRQTIKTLAHSNPRKLNQLSPVESSRPWGS
jgi:hypothetical protein